jgi:hypothetical protein
MTRSHTALVVVFILISGLTACTHNGAISQGANAISQDADVVYPTYGVHNAPDVSPCTFPNCRYVRGSGEPADPSYPPYWTSTWTMYRVFKNYRNYSPPYDGAPPPETTFEVSYGTSYYDSTWSGPTGKGAMEEHYTDRCLPIFPISNHFSCSFISLGEVAFFVTYDKDRPKGMPPVCLFSNQNHPPDRDFVSHLPYSTGDSKRLGNGAQGYSFWISPQNGEPMQTGASPDRTLKGNILFGYAFAPVNGVMQPQSFYFSGYPLPPANAPIVSQNYTNFTLTKPDPAKTWDKVSGLAIATLPPCHLFKPKEGQAPGSTKEAPTWGDIGRWVDHH